MEKRIEELERKIELLTDALQSVSTANLKMAVYEMAIQDLLRERGDIPQFGTRLRLSVSDFLESNNPPPEVEHHILGAMNALLEAAGQLSPPAG